MSIAAAVPLRPIPSPLTGAIPMSDSQVISATFCARHKGEPLITVDHIAGDDATFTPDELRALGATLIKIADDSAFMTALREERARSALRGDYVVGE